MIDPLRHALFLDTGNNYSVPPGVSACQQAATTPAQVDACLDPNDHVESVMSLNMSTGAVNWAQRLAHADTWTLSCTGLFPDPASPCPNPAGRDTDFGAGPNLFSIRANGSVEDAVGAGQKSGVYWALDRDTGKVLWGTQVGPDGQFGGIEWGTATDGQRIYIPNGNFDYVPTALYPSGKVTNGGFWSALDPTTGKILWQTSTTAPTTDSPYAGTLFGPPPGGAPAGAYGSMSVANGVVYGEDQAGTFVGMDTSTGKILFSFPSGGASISAPAIAGGSLYWASGYKVLGATNNKIYAFGFPAW